MAGLNCRVTVGLLGVLLLGAARLARGWGECGAASARSAEGALGFEGLHRPPRWGAGGTDGWGPPEARLRGVPRREWWPYTLYFNKVEKYILLLDKKYMKHKVKYASISL